MPVCTDCRADKPLSEYRTYSGGMRAGKMRRKRSSRCVTCSRERLLHFGRAQAADKKSKLRAVLFRAKGAPCSDCGVSYPSYVMDLDHRPEHAKVKNLSRIAFWRHRPLADFIAEIEKCDVVCANCHRFRSWNRATEAEAVQMELGVFVG